MYPSIELATIIKAVIFFSRKITAATKSTINLCLELIPFGIISPLIYFDRGYYEYHGGKNEEQMLAIGGYESAFLANMVVPYLFEKSKTLMNQTTYHGIYQDDGMVVLKVKKSAHKIKDWLVGFQQTLENASGNQHLQFTAEIWINDVNLPPSVKKDRVQIVTNDKFSFLDMKIIWSPEG